MYTLFISALKADVDLLSSRPAWVLHSEKLSCPSPNPRPKTHTHTFKKKKNWVIGVCLPAWVCFEMGFLCNPNHSVDQAGLELPEICLLLSWVLGLIKGIVFFLFCFLILKNFIFNRKMCFLKALSISLSCLKFIKVVLWNCLILGCGCTDWVI